MSEAADLLKTASMTDPVISARPRPYYTAMRELDPVHFDEKLGMFLISRYEDIAAIQQDPLTFSVNKGYHTQQAAGFQEEFQAILERDGGGYHPDAIMSDPPYHTRIRKLMESAFTAHRVKDLEPKIEKVVVELIESMAGQGLCRRGEGLCRTVDDPDHLRTIGADWDIKDKIVRWSIAVTAQIGRMQDREQMQAHAKEICDLQNYLTAHDERARSGPARGHDFRHRPRKDRSWRWQCGGAELLRSVSSIRALLIAGNETTATALGNLFYILATQPAIAELLQKFGR